MVNILGCKKEPKINFCNLVEGCKIINEQHVLVKKAKDLNIPRQKCMKTKEELEKAIKDTIIKYKEIIFGADSPICMKCLDELQREHVIDKKEYEQKLIDDTVRKFAWDGLQKNIAMDGDTMIDRRTGEVLDPGVDYTYWKNKF